MIAISEEMVEAVAAEIRHTFCHDDSPEWVSHAASKCITAFLSSLEAAGYVVVKKDAAQETDPAVMHFGETPQPRNPGAGD